MDETKLFLKDIGILKVGSDYKSNVFFKDGGQYRFEVPGIQNPEAFNGVIKALDEYSVNIHRVTQTKGIMTLTDSEIKEMIEIAISNNLELFLSVGPRATYDTSATAQTSEGSRIAYRLRGYNNLVYAIEDVKRAINLGIRGILLYDEGLLYVLNKMRIKGLIPSNVHFKVSAHTGHGNPASAKLLEYIGANSINPVRDLQLDMLASIREAISIPLDIHTENPKSSGGFLRHFEVPEIIKVASPVYLKTGGSIAKNHNYDSSNESSFKRIRQVSIVQEMIDKYFNDAIKSRNNHAFLAIPEII
ncbi:peptidase [Methanobrevibacter filiformis]|nr:peptidase [Methanobrevibacter filiformis]